MFYFVAFKRGENGAGCLDIEWPEVKNSADLSLLRRHIAGLMDDEIEIYVLKKLINCEQERECDCENYQI